MRTKIILLTVAIVCVGALVWFSFKPKKTTAPLTPPVTTPASSNTATPETPAVPSIPCQITLVKNTCWKGYSVSVDYVDVRSSQHQQTVTLGPDDTQTILKFNCEIGRPHQYAAKFSPEIWVGDAQKTFQSTQIWQVPDSLPAGKASYEMPLCFPDDFQGVPTPPTFLKNCHCKAATAP